MATITAGMKTWFELNFAAADVIISCNGKWRIQLFKKKEKNKTRHRQRFPVESNYCRTV